jgi:ribosomal protein L13E
VKVVVMAKSLLTQQDRRLLLETRGILEELLETEEVLRDRALMKSINESRKDVKAGRVYTIGELKRKLREEGKV